MFLSFVEVKVLAKKFEVSINKPWCKGCSLCVHVCPKKVLELNERVKCEAVRQEDCIGCRSCENTVKPSFRPQPFASGAVTPRPQGQRLLSAQTGGTKSSAHTGQDVT